MLLMEHCAINREGADSKAMAGTRTRSLRIALSTGWEIANLARNDYTATVEGDSTVENEGSPAEGGSSRPSYEAPRITWREPYEPVSFGLSCAKQPGLPQC